MTPPTVGAAAVADAAVAGGVVALVAHARAAGTPAAPVTSRRMRRPLQHHRTHRLDRKPPTTGHAVVGVAGVAGAVEGARPIRPWTRPPSCTARSPPAHRRTTRTTRPASRVRDPTVARVRGVGPARRVVPGPVVRGPVVRGPVTGDGPATGPGRTTVRPTGSRPHRPSAVSRQRSRVAARGWRRRRAIGAAAVGAEVGPDGASSALAVSRRRSGAPSSKDRRARCW